MVVDDEPDVEARQVASPQPLSMTNRNGSQGEIMVGAIPSETRHFTSMFTENTGG
ncbi:hypothetical protein [Bradyrhizobium forestalis]|uniref:hypothetical protein n=1 Tax=Bradyrhizobium forestalis TaxID=1419263 RepID=UPI0013040FFD|nr:hypothetical protein [Bradyrhizobium forestalis]